MKEILQYVQPTGDLPEIVGSKVGSKLLVIGSAIGVWDDLARYDYQGHDLMAVNDMMMHFPGRLDYGATCHPDKLPGFGFFQAYEASHKPWPPMETHSHLKHSWVKWHWPLHRQGGTSGLFAVTVGILMGYDQIILAGVPCDASRRYFDPPGAEHSQFKQEHLINEWRDAAEAIFRGKVKSLSGRTKDLLGGP